MESESQQSGKKGIEESKKELMVETSFSEENEVELITTSVSDLSKESKEYDMRSDSVSDSYLQQIIDENDRDYSVNESTLNSSSTESCTEKELPEDNNISSSFLKEISCLREELSQAKKELRFQRNLRKKKEKYLVKLAKQLSRRVEEIKEKDKKYDKVKKEKTELSAKFLSLEVKHEASEKNQKDSKNKEAALVSSLKAQLAQKDEKYNEVSEKIVILNKSHEKSCEEFRFQLSEANQESAQLRAHLAKVDIITVKLSELVKSKKENYIESMAALIAEISSLNTQDSNTKENAEKSEQAGECQFSKSNQESEELPLKLDEVNTSAKCSSDILVDTKEKQNTKNIEEIMKVNLKLVKKCEEFHKQLLESNQESERLRSHVITNENNGNTSTHKNAVQRISIFIAIILLLFRAIPDRAAMQSTLCSPFSPGAKSIFAFSTKSDATTINFEAPWWAPSSFKQKAFEMFCSSRIPVRVEFSSSGSLVVRNLNNEISERKGRFWRKTDILWKRKNVKLLEADTKTIDVTFENGRKNVFDGPWWK